MSCLKRILHIECDDDIRTIAHWALVKISGFSLFQFSSENELLRNLPVEPADLILLDASNPGVPAEETVEKLRTPQQLRRVPIIFMTAKAEASELIYLGKLDCLGVITKPFDPLTLGQKVSEIWTDRILQR